MGSGYCKTLLILSALPLLPTIATLECDLKNFPKTLLKRKQEKTRKNKWYKFGMHSFLFVQFLLKISMVVLLLHYPLVEKGIFVYLHFRNCFIMFFFFLRCIKLGFVDIFLVERLTLFCLVRFALFGS